MFSTAEKLLLIYAAANFLLWLAAVFWTRSTLSKQPPILLKTVNLSDDLPFVSIILPARNEACRVLRQCVESLLKQNYAAFELIVVNDRSTDDTDSILQEIQKNFTDQNKTREFHILQGKESPDGWFGKPFAMQTALGKARGELILTTDADMIFAPEAVSTAIDYFQRTRCDALTLIPLNENLSFWEKAFMPVFEWFRMLAMPLHRVNDPQKRESLGSGNFFLFKREVLLKIGGFQKVSAEIAEDLALAQIIKDQNLNLRAEYAPSLFRTRMYSGLREIWQGFTKNFFAALRNSKSSALGGIFSIIFFSIVPNIFLIYAFVNLFGSFTAYCLTLTVSFLVVYLLQLATFAQMYKYLGTPLRDVFFAPLGTVLFGAILANSTYRVTTGKGVEWKSRTVLKQ